MSEKIGVFGGSFDPIHMGHLNLALTICEEKGLDKVLFCPAKISPFKVDNPPIASYEERCEMVELAIAGLARCELCLVDKDRKGPSFMIETLLDLKKMYERAQFFLIVASDTYAQFDRWKRVEEIRQIATPLVALRPRADSCKMPTDPAQCCDVSPMDISSKNLRQRLKNKLYCGHQIPAKVLDFICQNRLYY